MLRVFFRTAACAAQCAARAQRLIRLPKAGQNGGRRDQSSGFIVGIFVTSLR